MATRSPIFVTATSGPTAILPYLEIERAVHGYGVNPDEDLSGSRGRRFHVLPPQDVGATELPDDDGFHPFTL